jgi:hypothetical protein
MAASKSTSKNSFGPPPPTRLNVMPSGSRQPLSSPDYEGAAETLTEQLRLRELQGVEREMDERDLKSKFQAEQQAIASYFKPEAPKPRSGPTGSNSGWNVAGGKKFYGYEPAVVPEQLRANQAEYLKKLNALRSTPLKPLNTYPVKRKESPARPTGVGGGSGGGYITGGGTAPATIPFV